MRGVTADDEPTASDSADGSAGSRRQRATITATLGTLVILLFASGVVGWLASREPAFYRNAGSPGSEDVRRLAGRFVTKVAEVLRQVSARNGDFSPWELEMSDAEMNAWLREDLPRSHPELLATAALWGRPLSEPRIAFQPRQASVGVRVGLPAISGVAWAEVSIRLEGVNAVVLTVERAGLGSLPLPRDAVLKECGRQLARAGLKTALQRFQDRAVLVAALPDGSAAGTADSEIRLESLRLDRGSLAMAGSVVRGPRRRDTAAASTDRSATAAESSRSRVSP